MLLDEFGDGLVEPLRPHRDEFLDDGIDQARADAQLVRVCREIPPQNVTRVELFAETHCQMAVERAVEYAIRRAEEQRPIFRMPVAVAEEPVAELYWDAALFFPARGHEFSTGGVDAGDTDKLKTCRHGGKGKRGRNQ